MTKNGIIYDSGDDYGYMYYDGLDEYDALAAVAAANRVALRNAALVNRAWCAVALPFLWARPGENALGDDAIADAGRRAFYASNIRELNFSQRGPLRRAVQKSGRVRSGNEGDNAHAAFAG